MSDPTWYQLAFAGWGLLAILMAAVWVWAWRKGDVSVVDVAWSAGVGILAILYAFLGGGDGERRLLFACVAGVWAARLAIYLFVNRVWGKTEDGRYQRLRAHWGERANPYFFLFFQMQAFWAVLFAIPFLVVVGNESPGPSIWDWIGAFVVLLAMTGEALADAQLARFRAEPANKGRTCRSGLWRYSRHPNYFFEWLHWFGYIFLAVGSPYWWVALWGPILMILFLLFVTGIPHTEKQAIASRGEDYIRYQKETSMFIPWFPRRAGAKAASA